MSDKFIILTEKNKGLVSVMMGYSLATCDDILAKAKEHGYEKIRLPIPTRR